MKRTELSQDELKALVQEAYKRLNVAGRSWRIKFEVSQEIVYKLGLWHFFVNGNVPKGRRAAFSEILSDVEEQISEEYDIEALFVVVSLGELKRPLGELFSA